MQLGHIISDEPSVIGCFGSQLITWGDPARGDRPLACVQVACYTIYPPLLIHNMFKIVHTLQQTSQLAY